MIVWIASYPKSGNTWVRSIISSLIYTENGHFKFEDLKNIPQFPQKKYFDSFTNEFGNIHEIKKYWVLAQDKINLDKKIKFFKTHHANCKINEYAFTSRPNTLATIYIVRDPRNLVQSISNHFSMTITDSKKFLFSPRVIGQKSDKKFTKDDLLTILGSWKDHYTSWVKHNENLLLIKYEDLIKNPKKELDRIILFLKKFMSIKTTREKNNNILKKTSFENLKEMEKNGFFEENAFNKIENKKVNFFHLGPMNNWKKFLDKDTKEEIEKNFKNEMRELNYLN